MMRSMVLAFAAVMLATGGASADARAEAKELYAEGDAAFHANRYDDAVSAWERSYALSKEPGLLFNIGQAYRLRRKPGDCGKALKAYRKFLRLDQGSARHADAEGFAAEMKSCAATETPTTAEERADPPSAESDEGANEGRTARIAGLVIAGGGAALVVTGLLFGRRASTLEEEVTNACSNPLDRCDWATQEDKDASGRRYSTIGYTLDVVGLAAVAGGAVMYYLGDRKSRVTVSPTSRDDGAVLSWEGSW